LINIPYLKTNVNIFFEKIKNYNMITIIGMLEVAMFVKIDGE